MSNLIHIADRIFEAPLLITRQKARTFLSVLGPRIGIDGFDASRFEGEMVERDEGGRPVAELPYQRTEGGVAIITIVGTMVNRGAYIGASSGLVSYEGVQFQLKRAAGDPKVHSILLDIQTPGGEAIGAFETAEMIGRIAKQKRVVALVNGMAASAGYAMASAATEIITTKTGISGSIGVVMMHADYSRKLANEGVDPTFIFAGAHKVDGNPFEPLSKDVREKLQTEVSKFYDLFVAGVAAGRGKRMTEQMARETEAECFMGQDAVDIGLADRVGDFDSVLLELSKLKPKSSIKKRSNSMNIINDDGMVAEADHKTAMTAACEKSKAEGHTLGATDERERLSAIINTDGIKGNADRMVAAFELATDAPTMSADKVAAHAMKAGVDTPQKTAEELNAEKAAAAANNPNRLANRPEGADSLAGLSGQEPKKSGLSRLIDQRVA